MSSQFLELTESRILTPHLLNHRTSDVTYAKVRIIVVHLHAMLDISGFTQYDFADGDLVNGVA